jgi:CheY-like chemotaxis protein
MTASILIVDDMTDSRLLLDALLSDTYRIHLAVSGQEGLDKVKQHTPDLILLDLIMPGMDGLEVCEILKHDPDTQDIPIVFITGSTDDNEKLKAYELGADDFIHKPVNAEELTTKVSKILASQTSLKEAREMSQMAQQTALIAMTNSSELGMILKFMESANEATSFEALAKHLEEITQNFGVICCFQFNYEDTCLNFGNGCVEDSLEARMITEARKAGGIIGHGKRMFFNQHYVSMLVKNMPVEDEDKCGRYKDNLSMLLSAANGIAKTIGIGQSVARQRKQLIKDTLDSTFDRTQRIMSLIRHLESSTVNVVQDARLSFEEALYSLGLTEEQENNLIGIFNSAMDKMDTVKETAVEVEDTMTMVVKVFEKLLNEDETSTPKD